MAKATYRELTDEQVPHFLDPGYVTVEQALPRERVVPEREARQARMLAEQKRRLGIA